MKTEEKSVYVPPKIELVKVEMDASIAAGSVQPTDNNKEVSQEWQSEADKDGSFSW